MPLPCEWVRFRLLYIGQDIGHAFEVILFLPKGFQFFCVWEGGVIMLDQLPKRVYARL